MTRRIPTTILTATTTKNVRRLGRTATATTAFTGATSSQDIFCRTQTVQPIRPTNQKQSWKTNQCQRRAKSSAKQQTRRVGLLRDCANMQPQTWCFLGRPIKCIHRYQRVQAMKRSRNKESHFRPLLLTSVTILVVLLDASHDAFGAR